MRYCRKCHACWRINYPFGRKSGGRIVFIREHSDNCRYNKGNKR